MHCQPPPWGKYRKLNMIISYNLHILILGINFRLGIQKCMCYRFNLEISKMGWNNVRQTERSCSHIGARECACLNAWMFRTCYHTAAQTFSFCVFSYVLRGSLGLRNSETHIFISIRSIQAAWMGSFHMIWYVYFRLSHFSPYMCIIKIIFNKNSLNLNV